MSEHPPARFQLNPEDSRQESAEWKASTPGTHGVWLLEVEQTVLIWCMTGVYSFLKKKYHKESIH